MPPTRRPAIVLSSGGLDSTTCLAIAKGEGYAPLYSLSFDYGQRHRHELDAAARAARQFGAAEHRVITIDLRQFGGSALTADIALPTDRHASPRTAAVPTPYGRAPTPTFLSYALAWAEVRGVLDVFVGVNAVDYSGYPDCRREFVAAFETMANLATKMTAKGTEAPRHGGTKERFKVHAPLIHLTKAQIIQRGAELGVDYGLTHSCYDPDESGRACGRCDS